MTQDDAGSAPMLGSVANGQANLDGWIPVTERLPPHNETVLYTCDLGPNEGFTDVESGRWEGARNDMGQPAMRPVWGDEDDWGPCSHWMPLPAPPSDEQNCYGAKKTVTDK